MRMGPSADSVAHTVPSSGGAIRGSGASTTRPLTSHAPSSIEKDPYVGSCGKELGWASLEKGAPDRLMLCCVQSGVKASEDELPLEPGDVLGRDLALPIPLIAPIAHTEYRERGQSRVGVSKLARLHGLADDLLDASLVSGTLLKHLIAADTCEFAVMLKEDTNMTSVRCHQSEDVTHNA